MQDVPPGLVAVINRALAKVPDERYPTMEAFRRELHDVFRGLTGESRMDGQPLSETTRTVHAGGEDLDTTLATPSSGVMPGHITPPSGALARQPAPSDATPTSASISAASRRPLELVNFRDPLADTLGEEPAAGARRTSDTAVAVPNRRAALWAGAITGLAVVAFGAYVMTQRGARALPKPVALPPRAAPATPALEFPEPKMGHGESAASAAAAAPTPAPPPPAPAAVSAETSGAQALATPVPVKPVAAQKYRVQFSSVPVATLSVDGKSIGPSIPARTLQLDEGEHTVRFEARGFPAHERTIHVSAKSDNRIHYQFPVSMLIVRAPEWAGARLLVDGKYRGTLPEASRLRLSPGSYNLTLSREGASPVTEKIHILEGAEKTWSPPPPSPAAPGGTP